MSIDSSRVSGEGPFRMRPKDFLRFPSPSAFLDAIDENVHITARARRNHRPSWTGETYDELCDRSRNGYTGAVPEAEKILTEIEHEIDIHGLTPRWTPDVIGPYPNVPAYLSGDPRAMWRKQDVPVRSKQSEINVYYCTTSSAGLEAERLHRRGIAVLAAVMALSRVRPVNVYLFTTLCGIGDQIIRLRTNPMVLSESAYIMTSVAFDRTLTHSYAFNYQYHGGWSRWSCTLGRSIDPEERIAHMRECLDADEEDVIIPGIHLFEDKILENPVTWINGLLDRYRG